MNVINGCFVSLCHSKVPNCSNIMCAKHRCKFAALSMLPRKKVMSTYCYYMSTHISLWNIHVYLCQLKSIKQKRKNWITFLILKFSHETHTWTLWTFKVYSFTTKKFCWGEEGHKERHFLHVFWAYVYSCAMLIFYNINHSIAKHRNRIAQHWNLIANHTFHAIP